MHCLHFTNQDSMITANHWSCCGELDESNAECASTHTNAIGTTIKYLLIFFISLCLSPYRSLFLSLSLSIYLFLCSLLSAIFPSSLDPLSRVVPGRPAHGHTGQWREQARTANYCSRADNVEGTLCAHLPNGEYNESSRIMVDHWSCCGSRSISDRCTDPAAAAIAGPAASTVAVGAVAAAAVVPTVSVSAPIAVDDAGRMNALAWLSSDLLQRAVSLNGALVSALTALCSMLRFLYSLFL
jgi:hypothetical protein